ncbi:MAG: hypothetical protein JWP75_1209 [Frondihabitans sp.]|nr:hypothetical protein [Frondihabitans sp.]
MATTLPLTLLGTALRWRRAGQRWSVANARQLQAPETVLVESSSFGPGGAIPFSHAGAGVGANSSPALAFSNLPDATAQLLLVIEDIDVPMARPLLHTIALIDAGLTDLAEGALDHSTTAIRFVPAAFGRSGYQGPRALPGHGPHRYGFHVFALDRAIPKDAALADFAELLPWVDGQVLAHGTLVGTQQR